MKKNLTFASYLLLFASILFGGKTFAQNPVKESTGVYQFADDDPTRKAFFSDKKGTIADNGMVASAHPEASKVGVEVLKMGGNAIDAAVATHFALAVVYPVAGNIGGGGFLVYRDKNGKNFTLDFREKAPAKAEKDMYLDAKGDVISGLSFVGHLASGVPGSVDGMVAMHQKFGKLSWKKLLKPAIDLAENGVVLSEREALGLNRLKADLIKFNGEKSPYFIKSDGTTWEKGDILIQKDLAKVLKLIQKKKRKGFYEGKCAALLTAEMERGKGLISQEDLQNYHSVWRDPLVDDYKNYKVITMPPPSSGGVALMQLLKTVEQYPMRKWGWNSDSTVQVIIEAERRVYADRAKWLGDPDFVQVPVNQLISKDYLTKRWENFDFQKASESKNIKGGDIEGFEENKETLPPKKESLETTHYSVVDKEGNAVSITTTLNGGYGSHVVVQGAGFLMNNEMDDFSVKPGVPNAYGAIGNKANAIAANKRMLSSMTPTIIEKDGKLLMAVGTPGGTTIITSVFQTIINVLEFGMTMQQAVNALKFHHQWLPDKTMFEQNAISDKTMKILQNKGFVVEFQKNTLGRMDCILVLPDGKLEGASDPRGDNTSVGF